MTEYGRGQGSEPWHPDDPLHEDGGRAGQQGQQSSYDGQAQYYPQQYGGGGTAEQQGGYEQYGRQQGDQLHGQQYASQQAQHPGQQYPDQYHPGQQYPDQQNPGQQYGTGGWPAGAPGHPQDPYAASDPYGQQGAAYGAQQSDYYAAPDAYPPPEPPARRGAEPGRQPERDVDPRSRTGWDPGPDQGEQAFFSGDDQDDDPGGRGDRRRRGARAGKGKGAKDKKRRSGLAYLMVVLALGGGVVGVGYVGWQFVTDRFGGAPDFAGDGNGEQVTLTIPKGAGGYAIGQVLKKEGVVKSVDAFVAAQASNPQGKTIQDGVYTLQLGMSAESAVELILNPKSRNNLITIEGARNASIYELVDKRLKVSEGTTAKVAKEDWEKLGLPDWAVNQEDVKDPLEGFLFPSSYGVAEGQTPEDVLKAMVAQATTTYEKLGVEEKAESLGLEDPWQLITVASLVQAEGTSHSDFRKMSEVIYNRLKPDNTETNGLLEFDSTYNYVRNQSKLDLTISELRNYDNPYNTYFYRGLPPGPISNPGEEAIKGALSPTDEGWYYFISLDGKTSEFTKTNAEHAKLVEKWNESRKNG